MGNLPIGQGESVTPMQMATAYSAIANGGHPAPAAHRQVDRRQGDRDPPPATGSSRRPPRRELRDMLRGVLADGGTASGAAIPGYDMAGKTGTANVVVDGHYSSSAYVASFIGMVPTDHPQAARGGDRRPAAGVDLRRLGGGAGVPEDRRLGGAVPRDLRRDRPAELRSAARRRRRTASRPSWRRSTASRSSHSAPTAAIHRTASDSGSGVNR